MTRLHGDQARIAHDFRHSMTPSKQAIRDFQALETLLVTKPQAACIFIMAALTLPQAQYPYYELC